MLSYITAIILGVVEGGTEMLPISSTGHLILINQWFHFGSEFTELFDIVIQVGAILSVLMYFWSDVNPFQTKQPLRKILSLWKNICVSVTPILVFGYFYGENILEHLFTPSVVALALIGNGILLWYVEDREEKNIHPHQTEQFSDMTFFQSLCVGFANTFALIPGMSRSASALIGGRIVGFSKGLASRYSMLLAIPVLTTASGYSLIKYEGILTSEHYILLGIGLGVSFTVCSFTVRWFFNFIGQYSLKVFAYYRIILGFLVLLVLS